MKNNENNNDKIMQIITLMTNNYHYSTLFFIISRYSKLGVGAYASTNIKCSLICIICHYFVFIFHYFSLTALKV